MILLCLVLAAAALLFWRGKDTAGTVSDPFAEPVMAEPSELNKNILAVGDGPMYPLETAPPYTIALDAGHGGSDSGAQGVIEETKLTEATVAALQQLLAADPNYNPVLCRAMGEAASVGDRADVL